MFGFKGELIKKKLLQLDFIFFSLFLLANLINIWSVDIYSTMDGPSHLYNASLLNYFNDSSFLKEYYAINVFYLPNYLPQLILKQLISLVDPFIAEKFFLSIIAVILPLSFRYAVLVYSKKSNFSFLIFSMIFSVLFNTGFFNFSLAFIFLNCNLILLNYFLSKKKVYLTAILFFLNSVALYYTHPFVYCISIALTFLIAFIHLKHNLKECIRTLIVLTLLLVPTLILFYLFYFNIHIPPQSASADLDIPFYEKLMDIVYFGPAITFFGQKEAAFSFFVAVLLLVLITLIILKRFFLNIGPSKFVTTDVFFILAILLLPLIFFTHNGILGGMFTKRLVFLFFYFFIFWISCHALKSKFILVASIFVIGYSYVNLSLIRHEVIKGLGYQAREVVDAATYIKNKSIVHVAGYPNSYLYRHFSNYACINKEVVFTENYEALLGWFPLMWTKKIYQVGWATHENDLPTRVPDYILIFGNQDQINETVHEEFKAFVNSSSFLIYQSKYDFCRLYKVLK